MIANREAGTQLDEVAALDYPPRKMSGAVHCVLRPSGRIDSSPCRSKLDLISFDELFPLRGSSLFSKLLGSLSFLGRGK